jgi:hypothetical protein
MDCLTPLRIIKKIKNRVVRLYPQAPGSLFFAYDSQGYGEGIPTHLTLGSTLTIERVI